MAGEGHQLERGQGLSFGNLNNARILQITAAEKGSNLAGGCFGDDRRMAEKSRREGRH